jgi:2,4-dienoyl-CoA reductase
MDNEEPKNQYFKANVSPMLPQNTFKNKLAYITGGGTGLGKQMALTLSKLGADVIIVSRKLDILEKTSKEIESITGNQVAILLLSKNSNTHL